MSGISIGKAKAAMMRAELMTLCSENGHFPPD